MAKLSGSGLLLLLSVSLCLNLTAQSTPDIFQQIETVTPGQGKVKDFTGQCDHESCGFAPVTAKETQRCERISYCHLHGIGTGGQQSRRPVQGPFYQPARRSEKL